MDRNKPSQLNRICFGPVSNRRSAERIDWSWRLKAVNIQDPFDKAFSVCWRKLFCRQTMKIKSFFKFYMKGLSSSLTFFLENWNFSLSLWLKSLRFCYTALPQRYLHTHAHTHAHTHPCTHTPMHTQTHKLSFISFISVYHTHHKFSLPLLPSLLLSQTDAHPFKASQYFNSFKLSSLSLSLKNSRTRTHTLLCKPAIQSLHLNSLSLALWKSTPFLSLSNSNLHTHPLPHPDQLRRECTHTHTLSFTHTHTHTLSFTHTHTHTQHAKLTCTSFRSASEQIILDWNFMTRDMIFWTEQNFKEIFQRILAIRRSSISGFLLTLCPSPPLNFLAHNVRNVIQ